MANLSPSVVGLRPLRDQGPIECAGEKNARRIVVKEIEASFKKFGCVCVPVSDLDHLQEVRASKLVVPTIAHDSWLKGSSALRG